MNVLSELNIELEITRSKITGEETFLRAIIPSHPFKIQIQLATDAKITAPKLQIDPSVSLKYTFDGPTLCDDLALCDNCGTYIYLPPDEMVVSPMPSARAVPGVGQERP